MKQKIRLGAGSAFWGDAMDPAEELLAGGELDYLGFDFLAELTMALLQRQKAKDPQLGYVPDAVQYMKQLMPLAHDRKTKLVSNGGGVNPRSAAQCIVRDAKELGLTGTRVALVEGDDLFGKLDELVAAGVPMVNMDSGDTDFAAIRDRVVAANAYTDCSGIVQGLEGGADIVIAGRVSDNAVYVGPIMHEFGWKHTPEFADKIAAAVTLGHVVECAAACSGGISSRYADMPNMGKVGFPAFDFYADGSAEVFKLAGTGGRVDQFTIKEHLVYEINDPSRYLMPDGVADFTSLTLEDLGNDRVRISNVKGEGAPDLLKLVIGYSDGWIGECMAFFPWPDAYGRAQKAKETMLERFERLGLKAEQIQFDFIGINMLNGPAAPLPDAEQLSGMNEIGLRCAVRTRTRDEAEKVRRAGAHLWVMGPGGTAIGTPMKSRPVVSLWPTLIPREFVKQTVEILEA